MSPTNTLHALFRAIDTQDAAAIAELLTDDAAMVDELSKGWVRGKARIRDFVGATFAAVDSISSALSDVVIRDSRDHATATFTLTQSYVLNGRQAAIVAPTSVMLERSGGSWLISVMHSVPPAGE